MRIRMNGAGQRDTGFTLVELMVALVLGVVVLGGVLAVYMTQSSAARYWNGVMRAQENGRFAVDVLSRTLRMQGYSGGSTLNLVIDGGDGETQPPDLSDGSGGEEIDFPAYVTNPTSNQEDSVEASFTGDAPAGFVIRDCHGQTIASGTQSNRFEIERVYNDEKNWREDSYLVCTTGNGTLRLAEGVEAMRVRYGVRGSADPGDPPVRYLDWSNVSDPSRVVSVEIALLINSFEPALGTPGWVCLGCSTIDPLITPYEDPFGRVRVEFRTTIDLRGLNLPE